MYTVYIVRLLFARTEGSSAVINSREQCIFNADQAQADFFVHQDFALCLMHLP